MTYSESAAETLRARRKVHVARREEWLAEQRACASRGDRDGARHFKGEAGEALRQERAATMVLEYMEGNRATLRAPAELTEYVNHEARCAEFGVAAS